MIIKKIDDIIKFFDESSKIIIKFFDDIDTYLFKKKDYK